MIPLVIVTTAALTLLALALLVFLKKKVSFGRLLLLYAPDKQQVTRLKSTSKVGGVIYAVYDPDDDTTVRYIGQTTAAYVSTRMTQHVRDAIGGKTLFHTWLAEQINHGKQPRVAILAMAPNKTELNSLEKQFINQYSKTAFNTAGNPELLKAHKYMRIEERVS